MRHRPHILVVLLAFALILEGCATQLKQAEKLEAAGSYQEAIASYEQIVQLDPDAAEARQAQLKIAEIYRDKLSQPEEAIARYQKVAEQYPGTEEGAEALYQAGVQFMTAEKYEDAVKVFDEVINKYPEHQQSHYAQLLLAKAYEKTGDSDQASEIYASFARRSDDSKRSVQALLSKAKLDQEMGKQESATQALQDAIKQYGNDPEAQEELQKAKTELEQMGASVPEPTQVDTRDEMREARRERDRPRSSFYGRSDTSSGGDSAEARYTNSFNVNPDQLMRDMQIQGDEQGTVYDAMFMVGNMFFSMEDYNSAGALYERGIQMARAGGSKLDPQNYRKLADCYAKIGLQAKAEETLQMAAKADPEVIDSIIESGNFEYQGGDYQKAADTYRSALGILPSKDADVYYHLGLAYQKLGDAKLELEYFERTVAAQPNNKDALQHLAEVLAYRAGNRPRAEIFQDLVDARSSTFEMQKELADVCFKYMNYQWARTKYTSASRIAERKITHAEDEAEIAELKQQVLTGQVMAEISNAYRGKADEARAAFDALAAANPDSPVIDLGNGYFAQLASDPDAAVTAYTAALGKQPGFRDAALALGEYYLGVGKEQQALDTWQTYLKAARGDRDIWSRSKALEKKLQAAAEEAAPPTEEVAPPVQEETPADETDAAEESPSTGAVVP